MDAVQNLKVSLVIYETAWTPFAENFNVWAMYFSFYIDKDVDTDVNATQDIISVHM